MVKTEIISGAKRVISTGQFLSKRDGALTLSEGDDSITIEYRFVQEEGVNDPSIKGEVLSNSHARITFVNFDNANLGLGSKDLIDLGTFGDKKIFFAYKVTTLDDKELRTFEFTV